MRKMPTARSMSIDWTALGGESVDLLRRYLMIDTTNPPGNEADGATFLAAVLERDGIASEIVESTPGRANLMARLTGDGSLPGIVLHHHIDVVYADRRYWTVDPFGGVVRDDYLYGRGAIDMKSTGIMHLAALLAIKRSRVRLKRALVLLATADEEAGSLYGAQFIADQRRDWLAGAEYAISELGGVEAHAGFKAPLGHIVISEKTGLPLALTAKCAPGHGSIPWPDTAPHRLIRALNRLLAADDPQEIVGWIRRVIDDDRVEVTITGEAKVPNLSPVDTELYKALADTLRRRAPGAVVAPEILVAFTDNWVFRRCGLHGYGWSPFIMDEGEWHRVHGNDERLSRSEEHTSELQSRLHLVCRLL